MPLLARKGHRRCLQFARMKTFDVLVRGSGIVGQSLALALSRLGLQVALRPDHVPTMEGDSNEHAGYSAIGRLFAIGYLKGLRQAVYAE